MPTKTTLRMLLTAEIVLLIASVAASSLGESSLPEALRTFESAPSEDAADPVMLATFGFFGILLVALVVAWIGLFVFWPPARRIYLATSVLGIVATPWFGPYIETGWSTALGEASTLLAGVILSAIYWSPLNGLFEPTPTPPTPATQ